jgi:hypothetical protein
MEQVWQYLVWFCLHRVTRYVCSWLLALATAGASLYWAWDAFSEYDRDNVWSRNYGHVTIDFGGQWLMGAMLAQGHGEDLYDRRVQREVLKGAYPYEEETPDERRPDKEKGKRDYKEMMSWFMGHEEPEALPPLLTPLGAADPLGQAALAAAAWSDEKPEGTKESYADRAANAWVGGPLYPPINAFVYAPLGALRPWIGYRFNQVLCLVYAFLAGLGVSFLTRGRFWCPLATTLILIYPGFKGALHLGQNPPLTLMILIWGWALVARRRPTLGGLVLGLLAFKPVWALAFFLVPFLSGRVRTCVAMALCGIAQIVVTLPFVGFHSWLHWLKVGNKASELYKVDQNWIYLSRDILSIPRRFLVDFTKSYAERDVPLASWIGWSLLLGLLGLTISLAIIRNKQARQATVGPIAAFLFLGAWMSCFHFMYYDVLLTALPMFLLFDEPRKYLEPIFVAILPVRRQHLGDELADYYGPWPPTEYPSTLPLVPAGHQHLWVLNRMAPTLVFVLLFVEHVQPHLPIDAMVTGHVFGTPVGFQVTTKMWQDGQPWDTYVVMFLWLWCGILWLRTPLKAPATPWPDAPGADVVLLPAERAKAAESIQLRTDIVGSHEGFADQYRPDARGLQP